MWSCSPESFEDNTTVITGHLYICCHFLANLREASSLNSKCHAELVLQSRVLLPAICQFLLQLHLPLGMSLFHWCNFFRHCPMEINPTRLQPQLKLFSVKQYEQAELTGFVNRIPQPDTNRIVLTSEVTVECESRVHQTKKWQVNISRLCSYLASF